MFDTGLTELLGQGAVGKTGKVFKNLAALSTRNNLETIHRLMLHLAPMRTLETGFAFGGSTLVICASHKELGHSPECQHVVIDPHQRTVWDSCGLVALDRASLSDYADFHEQPSALVLPKLLEAKVQFEFAYIDGSHVFEDVFVDAYFVVRLLAMGGVVAFDDSTSPHIAKVLKFLRRVCRPGLQEIDLTPFRASRAGLPYRLSRRFGKVQLTAFRRVGEIERAWDSRFIVF